MRFTPKSEAEVQAGRQKFEPFPPGQYDFEVIKATDEKSSRGNDMLHLQLKIYHPREDWTRYVHDYLVEAMEHKLRHFAFAVGLGIAYESGALNAASCEGRSGKVALRIKKDAGYDAKNDVVDYVVPPDYQEQKQAVGVAVMNQNRAAQPIEAAGAPLSDDDIPFTHGWNPCLI